LQVPHYSAGHKAPGQRPAKFARVVFPQGFTLGAIRDTLRRFPESDGFRCDIRQVGPLGFSLPLDLGGVA